MLKIIVRVSLREKFQDLVIICVFLIPEEDIYSRWRRLKNKYNLVGISEIKFSWTRFHTLLILK